jgi:hypothetical protein
MTGRVFDVDVGGDLRKNGEVIFRSLHGSGMIPAMPISTEGSLDPAIHVRLHCSNARERIIEPIAVLSQDPVCRPGNERRSPQSVAHGFPPGLDACPLWILAILDGAPYDVAATDTPSQDQEGPMSTPRHPLKQEHRCHEYKTADDEEPIAEPAEDVRGLSRLWSHDRGPADDQGDGDRDRLPATCPGEAHFRLDIAYTISASRSRTIRARSSHLTLVMGGPPASEYHGRRVDGEPDSLLRMGTLAS